MEYHTRYPKSILLDDGTSEKLVIDSRTGIEQLHIIITNKIKFEKIYQLFQQEGFTKVKFEHKQPDQLGRGLSLKLKKPWEIHLRLSQMNETIEKDAIMIHAEVEVSRDYMQHLFSQRTPIIYEIINILEHHKIDYKIWNFRIKKYIQSVTNDYKIKLSTPSLPTLAWKPMVYSIGTVGTLYLTKYLLTI